MILPWYSQIMKNFSNLIRSIIPQRWRPIGYLMHLAWSQANGRVQTGSFKGMKYVDDLCGSVGAAYIPKILGIYEKELESYINKASSLGLEKIINVGGGEGYYAIGLALKNPAAYVTTFEMEDRGRDAIRQMAELNAVEERVEVLGKCELEDLNRIIADSPKTLIVMDVEAYEMILLNPKKAPNLKNAYILVELHDFIQPGIAEELKHRFEPTHLIERIWQTERSIKEFPYRTLYTKLLPKKYLEWTVSEWRPVRMSWYWIEPNSHQNQVLA